MKNILVCLLLLSGCASSPTRNLHSVPCEEIWSLQVDPDRYVRSMSVASKILHALAAGVASANAAGRQTAYYITDQYGRQYVVIAPSQVDQTAERNLQHAIQNDIHAQSLEIYQRRAECRKKLYPEPAAGYSLPAPETLDAQEYD